MITFWGPYAALPEHTSKQYKLQLSFPFTSPPLVCFPHSAALWQHGLNTIIPNFIPFRFTLVLFNHVLLADSIVLVLVDFNQNKNNYISCRPGNEMCAHQQQHKNINEFHASDTMWNRINEQTNKTSELVLLLLLLLRVKNEQATQTGIRTHITCTIEWLFVCENQPCVNI